VITQVRGVTGNVFSVVVSLYSTPREVNELSLRFATSPPARVSCGTTSGCRAEGDTLTLDVAEKFAAWFQDNTAFGSLSQITVPVTIQGDEVRGNLRVTLTNSQGSSNTVSTPLR
jgi:Flp pilus assembly protein TadG